jgi:hypothetical protein
MITKKHTLIFAFAVCALALAALGSPKQAVKRPFKIEGHLTATFNLSSDETIDGIGLEWGEATHFGRYANRMNLHLNVQTGHLTGDGVATTANGDKVFYVMEDNEVTFTGGTGRFEGATGWFQWTPTDDVPDSYPDANTLVRSFTYEGIGTIIY